MGGKYKVKKGGNQNMTVKEAVGFSERIVGKIIVE